MAKGAKSMMQPINLIFRFLNHKSRVCIWLVEQNQVRLEGVILGFDEFMNVTLDQAQEVDTRTKEVKPLGRILLRGDNIALIQTTAATVGY